MSIYLLVIEDRHSDVKIKPFLNYDKAVSKANELAKEYCTHKEDLEENHPAEGTGILYRCVYSCEGDSVSVITAQFEDLPF